MGFGLSYPALPGLDGGIVKRALVIVDVQSDFVTGSLKVPDAAQAVRAICDLASQAMPQPITSSAFGYDVIAGTRDLHPANHCSFYVMGGQWPVHCVKGTPGAQYFGGIEKFITPGWHFVKGYRADREEYSGAYALARHTLVQQLRAAEIDMVDVVGLAFDVCVSATAIDLAAEGFRTRVLEDCTASVAADRKSALAHLRGADVEVV